LVFSVSIDLSIDNQLNQQKNFVVVFFLYELTMNSKGKIYLITNFVVSERGGEKIIEYNFKNLFIFLYDL
jgi:hypothetical protein